MWTYWTGECPVESRYGRSDTCLCLGVSRGCCPSSRPYVFLGYLICSAAYLTIAALALPSAPSLALLLGCATFGMVMADTTCDSLVVER